MENKNWLSHIEWAVMFVMLLGMHYSMNARIDVAIESINDRVDSSNTRFDQFMMEWKQESKDFHGRLCAIEERNKK